MRFRIGHKGVSLECSREKNAVWAWGLGKSGYGCLMAENTTHTTTWPELAAGLFEKLTARNAEITYDFVQLEISVPSGVGAEAQHAQWKLNGTIKIRTRDQA